MFILWRARITKNFEIPTFASRTHDFSPEESQKGWYENSQLLLAQQLAPPSLGYQEGKMEQAAIFYHTWRWGGGGGHFSTLLGS